MQLNMLGTWIPLALIALSYTYKAGWVRIGLCAAAILLVTISTIIWFRLAKRRRL